MVIESEPDDRGRVSFTLFWRGGAFRRELDHDGAPVGLRRAQCFFAQPDYYIRRGAIVVATEAEAIAKAWREAK